MDNKIIKIYRDKLEEQKKRTIIIRKEKVKHYEMFIKELEKELYLINSIELSGSLENLKLNDLDLSNKYIQLNSDMSKLQDDYISLKNKYNELKKENEIIKKRYNALRNSKLGKIMIKYWKFKKGA